MLCRITVGFLHRSPVCCWNDLPLHLEGWKSRLRLLPDDAMLEEDGKEPGEVVLCFLSVFIETITLGTDVLQLVPYVANLLL